MSKLIALKSAPHHILNDAWNSNFSNLKQQSLLFDQIGFLKLSSFYKTLEESLGLINILERYTSNKQDILNKVESIVTELQWLQQKEVVFELTIQDVFQKQPPGDFAKETPIQKFEYAKNLSKKIIEIQNANLDNMENEPLRLDLVKEQHFALLRLMSIVMETTRQVTAVTTSPYVEYTRDLPNSSKSDVAQIVISKLPLPNNETPWEQIIDYRNDPENQNNLFGLRRWIRKISKEELSKAEIEEEIEWRINEFRNHMKLHKMKANTETLEVLVKAPLEIIENLVSLKLSKISEPFFALKKRQLMLMEAEMNAPSKELAYIIKSREAFQSQE